MSTSAASSIRPTTVIAATVGVAVGGFLGTYGQIKLQLLSTSSLLLFHIPPAPILLCDVTDAPIP